MHDVFIVSGWIPLSWPSNCREGGFGFIFQRDFPKIWILQTELRRYNSISPKGTSRFRWNELD